jgi:predicted DNA-binding transcriptional regulator AlpA
MKTKTDPLLDYAGIAALIGVGTSTVRAYAARGYLPEPDSMPVPDRPRWHRSTIRAWHASRPGRGAPGVKRN